MNNEIDMHLVTTYICKASDLGVANNLFGGKMLAWLDESAGAFAAQVCDTPKMVTVKIDECVFHRSVRTAQLIKIYCGVERVGHKSITLKAEARRKNVYTGIEKVVTSTHITFVRVDDEGESIPISDRVRKRYEQQSI